ncbi:hypothetical protein DH2020_015416 [Rehmannia glutinosa]|uniref:HAT C-terminal dimerisation domain-containing protein n=1 Tax=Rehmannia glutinosa TaxID=99300 RepID=A0ABR0WW50_REHGL
MTRGLWQAVLDSVRRCSVVLGTARQWTHIATNNLKFRILSKMAYDVLAIPITIVASESAFSAGGRVIDPYRALLGVETVQVLLCAEDWLRARHGTIGLERNPFDLKAFSSTYRGIGKVLLL